MLSWKDVKGGGCGLLIIPEVSCMDWRIQWTYLSKWWPSWD